MGGSVKAYSTRAETVRFRNVAGTLAVTSEGWIGSTEHDGLIGAPILSRLVILFDYGNERISFTDRRLFPLLEGGEPERDLAIYSAEQAIGTPDAVDAASYSNAWFPAYEHGKHWLELTYAEPVEATRMEVWGTTHWATAARASGSLHGLERPPFVAREALARHVERLHRHGQSADAERVRSRIETPPN